MHYPINPINIANLSNCQLASNLNAAIAAITPIFKFTEGKAPSKGRLIEKRIAVTFKNRIECQNIWSKYLEHAYFEIVDRGFCRELILKYWRVR